MCYQVNVQGKIRFSHDPSKTVREQSKKALGNEMADTNDIFSGYWWKKLMKSYTILYWFYAPQTPEKLSRIVDESFEKHYLMTKPDFDWSKEPRTVPMESLVQYGLNFRRHTKLMAISSGGLYFSIHDLYLRNLAKQRGTLLIIALRRYKNTNGQWPQQLEDAKNLAPAEIFIDPLNGGTFVYKRTNDSFTLYSKGKNNIDEDGEHKAKLNYDYRKIETIKDDLMIWPGDKAKTEQEKADAEQQ
jgi:hypothetical protein